MKRINTVICTLTLFFMFLSCRNSSSEYVSSCEYAGYFDISDSSVVVMSPFAENIDVFSVKDPVDNIICMSSSHVACLSSIGADSLISAVSGLRYISDTALSERGCIDIGFDGGLDYEKIMSLDPDVVTAYSVGGTLPPYVSKLRSLGIRVLVLYDHMETHPLARAEYMRLFGTLTGRRHIADSVFNDLVCRYMRVADDALRKNGGAPKAVMVNIPYGDVWYIPGEDSYLSCLIKDAGGWIIGAGKGSGSSVITMEDAYRYSQDADVWLNPGYCRTREQLSAVHQLFPMFGPIAENRPIYNNTLKITPEGGNDFYESGVVRPDLILEDLISIFSSQSEPEKLNYFIPL